MVKRVGLVDKLRVTADLGALRDQEDLFGGVASDSTAFGVIDSIDAGCLERLPCAVAMARSRTWKLGARPDRIVLDVDGTLTASCSDKEHAAMNFKGGCWVVARTSLQYLKAGLIDEMTIHLVPILLGDGARLFDNLGDAGVGLECIRAIEAPGVTHLTYRVQK